MKRRRYLGGTGTVFGGLLAPESGDQTLRYVGETQDVANITFFRNTRPMTFVID